jgi:hypothetical protein
LLYAVSRAFSLGINWYRTEYPGGPDGKLTRYLDMPEQYRHYNPEIFDSLHRIVKESGKRNIESIEHSDFMNAVYYSAFITARGEWHVEALQALAAPDVIFLDPDNGLEVKSTRGRNKDKYVLKSELYDYYSVRKKSVILYQHAARESESRVIRRMRNIADEIVCKNMLILRYGAYQVRYYIVFSQAEDADRLEAVCTGTIENWRGFKCSVLSKYAEEA